MTPDEMRYCFPGYAEKERAMDDLDDATIEDTVHCDLCGGPFGIGEGVIVESPSGLGTVGQLKLCDGCASLVHDAYRENLREAGVCEHGVDDRDYCEECNREYRRAREGGPCA